MKRKLISILAAGILTAAYILLTIFEINGKELSQNASFRSPSNEQHKIIAFEILDAKCNTCHRKSNPFMIFKMKNISKRAERIYQVLFEVRTMPKGDEVKLTTEEYTTLKKWLLININ